MAGEFDFIQWVRQQQAASPIVVLPAGDDLAVLNWPKDNVVLVGVDQVLDGVHFDSKTHAPRAIGKKVMNRNLSDCAAMACLPVAAVATVALPRGTGLDYAKELYLGLRDAADPFGCAIVGGDTAAWPHPLALTVTILGRAPEGAPVTRKGAKPGDAIYVTGPLGGSILGRHMTFEPRVQLGVRLRGIATAMIDLSDGLSRDLGHICSQSHVGAIIDVDAVPIHPDAHLLAQRDGIHPRAHALHDGEDHELLFTTSAVLPDDLQKACTRIGQITQEPSLQLRLPDGSLTPLLPQGWEHKL